jgi:hypothetical protein
MNDGGRFPPQCKMCTTSTDASKAVAATTASGTSLSGSGRTMERRYRARERARNNPISRINPALGPSGQPITSSARAMKVGGMVRPRVAAAFKLMIARIRCPIGPAGRRVWHLGLVANMRSRLRSGRTKLAAACWAICAFERQGHLVGTATGPPFRSAQPRIEPINPNRTAR